MAEYCLLANKELANLKTLLKTGSPDKYIDECLERIGYHIRKIKDYAHFERHGGYEGHSISELKELIRTNDILVYTDLSEVDDVDEFLLASMKSMDAAFVAMGYRSLFEEPPKPKPRRKSMYPGVNNFYDPNIIAIVAPIDPIQWDEEPEGV